MGALVLWYMVMSENQRDPQYKLRWPEELRDMVSQSAKVNNRSINAEIIYRLEQSFAQPLHPMEVADTLSEYEKPQEQKLVANDPRERRRLAKLAAESTLKDMPATDFMELLFDQLNKGGLALTLEEVKGNSSSTKHRINVDHKLPESKKGNE